jgi:beta-mannosidase
MLKEEPLSTRATDYGRVMDSADGWIEATVPGDVHVDLIAAGKIPEPLVGLNSIQCEWIEERSWWYKRTFATESEWLAADVVELELNGLDCMADVFLNGSYLGRHPSAFRPFICDVKELLRLEEENVLVVRLTSGLEHLSQGEISDVSPWVSGERVGRRGDKRRVYIRKPQYSWGWDWNPRVPTCGITGNVVIRSLKTAVIRDVYATTRREEGVCIDLQVTLESLDWIGTADGEITVKITDEDGNSFESTKDVFLRSGLNFVPFTIELDRPRLWWPNGMGEQHLYTIEVKADVEGEDIVYPSFRYGARTVELDQAPLNQEERLFAIVINGVRVYCRGGNWVPADSIYGRASDERYRYLVKEAVEANFTMLRVWGGGLYEKDVFYESCDQEGILVWQDFMFACAAYPDHLEWFADEVRKEAECQVTRLRNHACVALWSGSNENNWGFRDWWNEETKGGARTYNKILPSIIQAKSPHIPYWNGSPYGGDDPNSAKIGNRHHWHDCMMNEDMEKRITPEEYDKVDPKFISEYGYIGPCGLETTLRYLDGEPLDRQGEAWQHHNNTFEKDTVVAGIQKHYADLDDMEIEDYLFYAGLCQGMMYEYSLDSFRSRLNNSGGLFWMYNDCWGEVGWTIIDYYLKRKISYNFVCRANAPRRLILRERDGEVQVTLANDTPQAISGTLEYGYMAFDGSEKELSTVEFTVGPFARHIIHSFSKGNKDLTLGCLMARVRDHAEILPAVFRAGVFRDLHLVAPNLEVTSFTQKNEETVFTVKAAAYAHAVHFNLPEGAKLSDEYFDLLPGEARTVRIEGMKIERDMLKPTSVI